MKRTVSPVDHDNESPVDHDDESPVNQADDSPVDQDGFPVNNDTSNRKKVPRLSDKTRQNRAQDTIDLIVA
jgi:hypothetical protein